MILIVSGFPLIVDNKVVGAAGSAGHRGNGDMRAVKAGIAAWGHSAKISVENSANRGQNQTVSR